MTTKPIPNYGSAFQSKSGPQQPLVRTSTTVSPKNQIQNGYAQHGQTQYGHSQQDRAQPSNNRTPGAAAWTQPLVHTQNNYFTLSKSPPQPPSASPTTISSNKKANVSEDKPPSMTYLMKKSKCDSKKDPKDWQTEYEERKKQLAMGGALASSSPPKKKEQKPSSISRNNLTTSGQNLLTSGSGPSTAPSSNSIQNNLIDSNSLSEKKEDFVLESSSTTISPPKVQKPELVRRNSVDNKAHEEAEQDKLASILAFQPKNREKTTQEPLIKKSLVSEEYEEPLVNKSTMPLIQEKEAKSALYYQQYQAPPIVQRPTASPKLAHLISGQTISGSAGGPSTLAPSSGDSKRKVEEKAPDIQKLMKKAKCDSSRDAKDWQKEYEERKKLAMAAFKS